MIYVLMVFNIVCLIAVAVFITYSFCNGQIVIAKKLNKKDSAELLRVQKEQMAKHQQKIDEYQEMVDDIL